MTDDQARAERSSLPALATRAAIVTLAVALVVGILALLVVAAHVWLLVFAGLLLAVLLSTAADALSRWSGMPRGPALAATLAVLAAAGVGGFHALWPSISEQSDQLARQLPAAVQDLRSGLPSARGASGCWAVRIPAHWSRTAPWCPRRRARSATSWRGWPASS